MPTQLFPYPAPRRGSEHSTQVIRWMSRNALRQLRQLDLAGSPIPSAGDLADWLIEHSTQAYAHLDATDVAHKCAEAALFALDVYDPRFYDRRATSGRRGGSAGSHEISDEDLLRVRSLSHSEAARALSVSRSTIIRRRRAFDGDTAELTALFGTQGHVDTTTGEIPETNEGWPPSTTADLPLLFRAEIELDRAERLSGLDLLAGVEL